MKFKYLIGKTIVSVKGREDSRYDDQYLDLEFSDGTKCTLIGDYGGYTGKSRDKYPTFVRIEPFGYESEYQS